MRRPARLADPPVNAWGRPTGETTVVMARPVPDEPPTVPITLPDPPPLITVRRLLALGLFVAVTVIAVLIGYNLAVGEVISPIPVSCIPRN